MTETPVARPVHAIERPASMAMQVKTIRALKVLHGPGIKVTDNGDKHIFWTAGEICACMDCCARLAPFLDPLPVHYTPDRAYGAPLPVCELRVEQDEDQ